MSCERFRDLMMARLDGEITPSDQRDLDSHLAACQSCRREFSELGKITDLVQDLRLPKPSEDAMANYWPSVYARIERGLGWWLLIVGAGVWIGYGVFAFLTNPMMEALTKLLVALPIVGVLTLLVSAIRERCHVSRTERYGRVER